MNNEEDLVQEPKGGSALIKLLIFVVLIIYFYSIFFGDYSISVLLDAKDKKEELLKEYNKLQNINQKLQKKHFEMIQLTPSEDAF